MRRLREQLRMMIEYIKTYIEFLRELLEKEIDI